MIDKEIKKEIIEEIDLIEKEFEVKVLYACESGSRAWGFESTDSDYDVRFVYIHKADWYLSIQKKRDVIERPISDVLDVSGWDIRKALELFRKSNPPMLEWLQSPIVYRQHSSFADNLRDLMDEYYSPVSCIYHYNNMAKNNFREFLQRDLVKLKKYFYVLRPVLGCMWIENISEPVPMEFEKLVEALVTDQELKNEIDILLEKKKSGDELSKGPKNMVIDKFLKTELDRLEKKHEISASQTRDPQQLDLLFQNTLEEVWKCETPN